jgi:hypothetical protein
MRDVLNDFKVSGRKMTKNELKIKELQQRIDKAIEELKTANTVDIDSDRLCEIIEYVEFILKGSEE